MGRISGLLCLLPALAFTAVTIGLARSELVMVDTAGREVSSGGGLVRYGGLAAFFWLLTFVFLVGGNVWKRDDRFKPMPVGELLRQLPLQDRPFFVCLDCRVILPFEVAVGVCPRCEQKSGCVEVAGEKDFALVKSALAPDSA